MPAEKLRLTKNAVNKLLSLQQSSNDDQPLLLKVTIDSGGCSGFQYRFDLVNAPDPEDHVFDQDGAQVAIDDVSLGLIQGSEIDYAEEMIGSAFVIRNPNASSSCGCGNSFSL